MTANFFEYFPASPKAIRWGICAKAFGRIKVPPHSPYPPTRHPGGHHFTWERGRVLSEFQMIHISAGEGRFESAQTESTPVRQGMTMLLFPGIWHRYRPNPATGWTETWIELEGIDIERLCEHQLITSKKAVHSLENSREVQELWDASQRLAREKPPGFAVQMGFIALQILTLLHWKRGRDEAAPSRIEQVISEAQTTMMQQPGEILPPEAMAQKLGVGYSYFRRSFKKQTGLSPKQYQGEIRLRRAKNLLQNSSKSIKEISEELGYHSPYHLSLDFSKRMGLPPSKWRSAGSGDR